MSKWVYVWMKEDGELLIECGQANYIKWHSSQDKASGTNQGFCQAAELYLSAIDSRMWMQPELISSQDIKQCSSYFTGALWDSQANHNHMPSRLTLSVYNKKSCISTGT